MTRMELIDIFGPSAEHFRIELSDRWFPISTGDLDLGPQLLGVVDLALARFHEAEPTVPVTDGMGRARWCLSAVAELTGLVRSGLEVCPVDNATVVTAQVLHPGAPALLMCLTVWLETDVEESPLDPSSVLLEMIPPDLRAVLIVEELVTANGVIASLKPREGVGAFERATAWAVVGGGAGPRLWMVGQATGPLAESVGDVVESIAVSVNRIEARTGELGSESDE